MKRKTTSVAVLAVAVGLALTSTAPAIAGGDEVIKRGGCSGASVWKLKAKPDNGRLEVEGVPRAATPEEAVDLALAGGR